MCTLNKTQFAFYFLVKEELNFISQTIEQNTTVVLMHKHQFSLVQSSLENVNKQQNKTGKHRSNSDVTCILHKQNKFVCTANKTQFALYFLVKQELNFVSQTVEQNSTVALIHEHQLTIIQSSLENVNKQQNNTNTFSI